MRALAGLSPESLARSFESLSHLAPLFARKLILGISFNGKTMGLLLAWVESIPWEFTLLEMEGSGVEGASVWKTFLGDWAATLNPDGSCFLQLSSTSASNSSHCAWMFVKLPAGSQSRMRKQSQQELEMTVQRALS